MSIPASETGADDPSGAIQAVFPRLFSDAANKPRVAVARCKPCTIPYVVTKYHKIFPCSITLSESTWRELRELSILSIRASRCLHVLNTLTETPESIKTFHRKFRHHLRGLHENCDSINPLRASRVYRELEPAHGEPFPTVPRVSRVLTEIYIELPLLSEYIESIVSIKSSLRESF